MIYDLYNPYFETCEYSDLYMQGSVLAIRSPWVNRISLHIFSLKKKEKKKIFLNNI